jgi:lysophospholipase L1-like esterase
LEFEFGGSVKIKEWVINPTATIWKCYKKTRAIFLGDSITEGTAGQFSQTAMNYAALCGRMLGWDDTWLSGVGSTGYVTSGGGGKVRLYDRIMTDVAPYSPDVVVVAMGINDPSNMTTEQIQPTLELIRAVIPVDSPIFVLGVWNPRSIDVSSRNNAIKAAVSKIEHCYYVDENYFTGTGRVGSLQNNGNSDKYISNDTTHPTQDGAEYMAIRTATSISSLLSRM